MKEVNNLPEIRERSIETITAFYSINNPYEGEYVQRTRTFSQKVNDDLIEAIRAIGTIKKSIIIIHGAVGCSYVKEVFGKRIECYSTELNEQDTILGGEDKLRNEIKTRYISDNPEVIFVLSSPIVAINNDDIEGVVKGIDGTIKAKIIFVQTTGFKSKSKFYGYDLVFHSIGKKYFNKLNRETKENNFVNLIALDENLDNLIEAIKIIKTFGIDVNLLGESWSEKNIKEAVNAIGTIVFNVENGYYLGYLLKEIYNIPYLKVDPPEGSLNIRKFENSLRSLLKTKENRSLENNSKVPKEILKGTKVYLDISNYRVKGILNFIEERGGELVGVSLDNISSLDRELIDNIKRNFNIKIHVSNGQEFEKINILKKLKADIVITDKNIEILAEILKANLLYLNNLYTFGYKGEINLENVIEELLIYNFSENEEITSESIYKEGFFNKSSSWYIKQEVN